MHPLAQPYLIHPVVQFCGVIARDPSVRDWAVEQLTDSWGKPFLRFPTQPFDPQGYYRNQMGEGLGHDLIAIDRAADPAGLADWKCETNELESRAAELHLDDVDRPLNLDCGYITQAKFVLATTKNREHRIYLRNAMFAEITLTYIGGKWRHHDHTYPNYRTEAIAEFATRCRERLRRWIFGDS